MNIRLLGLLVLGVVASSIVPSFSAEPNSMFFQMAVLWENNMDKGVLLVSPTEMWIIDSKGQKYGKVISKEVVKRVFISSNTKKMAYTTASGVWVVKLETGESSQIASGDCNFLRWDLGSMSLMFTIDYYGENDEASPTANTKLFWADGDGKNIKQIYP